jgi:hypothetical protein
VAAHALPVCVRRDADLAREGAPQRLRAAEAGVARDRRQGGVGGLQQRPRRLDPDTGEVADPLALLDRILAER